MLANALRLTCKRLPGQRAAVAAAGFGAHEVAGADSAATTLSAGITATAYSAMLWLACRREPVLLALVAEIVALVVLVLADSVPLLGAPAERGVAAGLLIVRLAPTSVLESAPIRGFCCGLLTGAVLGVGAGFAGGPLGNGRMAAVGPSPWQVATVAALEVGIAAAITAGVANWWDVRRAWARNGGQAKAGGGPWSGNAVARPRDDAARQGGPWPTAGRNGREDDGHVIYLDRWADDAAAGPAANRSGGGPSALP